MKKMNFRFLLLILTGSCFISCQQDGIYTPKQKIKQITVEKVRYYAGDQVGEAESYSEDWTWKDKLLESVSRKTGDDIKTAMMTYDGKTIRNIDVGTTKISFSYKNGKIYKIVSTGDTYKKITVEVRDKGDIVELRYEMSDNAFVDKNSFEQTTSDLYMLNSMIMPGHLSKMFQKNLTEQKNTIANSKAGIVIVLVTLQYNSKNVGKQTIENKTTNTKEVYNYSYDSKKNPFFHSFMELLNPTVTGAPFFCSQNNITASYEESNPSVKTTYTYEYDDKDWPISCEVKTIFDPNFIHDYSLEKWKYSY
jgi:hypothetical protein